MKRIGADSLERLKQEKREKDVLNKISIDGRSLPSSPEESYLITTVTHQKSYNIPISPLPQGSQVGFIYIFWSALFKILDIFTVDRSNIFYSTIRTLFRIQPGYLSVRLCFPFCRPSSAKSTVSHCPITPSSQAPRQTHRIKRRFCKGYNFLS
jgi:hypothetical protein